MNLVARLTTSPLGVFAVLVVAASLEALGDSLFQAGMHRPPGSARLAVLASGAVVLAAYGALVNTPRWDFGRLIGVYVAIFFLMAQVLNRVRFGQLPSRSIWAGGALILTGSLVMTLWP